MRDQRRRRLPPLLATALALVLQGCGGDQSTSTPPPSAAPAPATSQTPGLPDQDAARVAGDFLTGIGDGQLLAAYRLLTRDAQVSLSYEQFAGDRGIAESGGRNLALAKVVSTTREGDTVLVTAQGRRAGGSPVELVVATVQTPEGWRVTGVPAGI